MKYLKYFLFLVIVSIVPLVENNSYSVVSKIKPVKKAPKPKKIILMIGDGMGLAQIYSGYTAKKGNLNIFRCPYSGFSITNSADDYITDSAAGGTALSCGTKTKNGFVGVDSTGKPLKTILELAEDKKLATGMVVTCYVTHATPASFIAHYPDRDSNEILALDFLKTDIDVLIGGGNDFFEKRKDQINLISKFESNGYSVYHKQDELFMSQSNKVIGLLADGHLPKMGEGRGDYLSKASVFTTHILNKNKNGFFFMIEGSQIDWGCHANQQDYMVSEMKDFDQAVGAMLDFAEKDGNTLVIITADHECGGLTITEGDLKTGTLKAEFSTKHHTGIMVPVFAYGPGSELFSGVYQNTEVFQKMKSLLIH